MNFFQHLANAGATLLCLRDPYPEPYQKPEVTGVTEDWRGNPVIHVKADNYIDACSHVEGTTYPGDVFRTAVHKQGRDWEIHVEPFRTEINELPEETKEEHQARIEDDRPVYMRLQG